MSTFAFNNETDSVSRGNDHIEVDTNLNVITADATLSQEANAVDFRNESEDKDNTCESFSDCPDICNNVTDIESKEISGNCNENNAAEESSVVSMKNIDECVTEPASDTDVKCDSLVFVNDYYSKEETVESEIEKSNRPSIFSEAENEFLRNELGDVGLYAYSGLIAYSLNSLYGDSEGSR